VACYYFINKYVETELDKDGGFYFFYPRHHCQVFSNLSNNTACHNCEKLSTISSAKSVTNYKYIIISPLMDGANIFCWPRKGELTIFCGECLSAVVGMVSKIDSSYSQSYHIFNYKFGTLIFQRNLGRRRINSRTRTTVS